MYLCLQTVISNIYPLYTTFFNYIIDWKEQSAQEKETRTEEDESMMLYAPESMNIDHNKSPTSQVSISHTFEGISFYPDSVQNLSASIFIVNQFCLVPCLYIKFKLQSAPVITD